MCEACGQHNNHEHSHENYVNKNIVLNRLDEITSHIESIKEMIEENKGHNEVLVKMATVETQIAGVNKILSQEQIMEAIKHLCHHHK